MNGLDFTKEGDDVRNIIAVLISLVALSGCVNLQEVEITTLMRRTSPDGKTDAILYSRDAGATTPTTFEVVVTKKGGSVEGSTLMVSMDHGEKSKANLRWVAPGKLSVYLPGTDVYTFNSPVKVGLSSIEISVYGGR